MLLLYNILWNFFHLFSTKEKFCLCRSGAGTPCCSTLRRSSPHRRRWAAKKESDGPLAAEFDELSADNRFGPVQLGSCGKIPAAAGGAALPAKGGAARRKRCSLPLAGTCRPSVRQATTRCGSWAFRLPGVYGACSTMAETLALGAALCAGRCGAATCWPWLPAISARQSVSSAPH